MNNAVLVTILVRAALAALLVLGGVLALYFGYRLYRTGAGLAADDTKIETKQIKINLRNVGAGVMLTAVAWAGLGYLTTPSFKSAGGDVTVAQTTIEYLPQSAAPTELAVAAPQGTGAVADIGSSKLGELFQQAADDANVTFYGKPGMLASDFQISKGEGGTKVQTEWKIDGASPHMARMTFRPFLEEAEDGRPARLKFLPEKLQLMATIPKSGAPEPKSDEPAVAIERKSE